MGVQAGQASPGRLDINGAGPWQEAPAP